MDQVVGMHSQMYMYDQSSTNGIKGLPSKRKNELSERCLLYEQNSWLKNECIYERFGMSNRGDGMNCSMVESVNVVP